jgi:hypothetical protein
MPLSLDTKKGIPTSLLLRLSQAFPADQLPARFLPQPQRKHARGLPVELSLHFSVRPSDCARFWCAPHRTSIKKRAPGRLLGALTDPRLFSSSSLVDNLRQPSNRRKVTNQLQHLAARQPALRAVESRVRPVKFPAHSVTARAKVRTPAEIMRHPPVIRRTAVS